MTSDTVRQKFLYNVPHLDNGLPMVKLLKPDELVGSIRIIKFSFLCKLELDNFKELLLKLNESNVNNIIIKNDLQITNSNIIIDAIKHDILAFAYWFKKANFKVALA